MKASNLFKREEKFPCDVCGIPTRASKLKAAAERYQGIDAVFVNVYARCPSCEKNRLEPIVSMPA